MSSTNSLAIKTDCGECKHCTPEQTPTRAALKEELEKTPVFCLKYQGGVVSLYEYACSRDLQICHGKCPGERILKQASLIVERYMHKSNDMLIIGKCDELDKAINIERFRRNWFPSYPQGCPDYVYEALKDDPQITDNARKAFVKYEDIHGITSAVIPTAEAYLFFHDSEYNNLPPKERMRQAALAVVNMPELTEERYRSRVDKNCPFGWDVYRAIECVSCLKDYGARVRYSAVYEMLNAPNDWATLDVIARKHGGSPKSALAREQQSKTAPLAEKSSLGVFVDKNRTWVSSLDVAERFGKRHNNVIRDIKGLECSEGFTALNFELSEYKDPTGRTLPQYLMTRDGFTFLAMGFTGARAARFKEAYINEFNRMEELLRGAPASQNAAALGERYEELNALYDAERKKSVTAMSTAAAAKRSEQSMKRRLNKALDALASLKRGQ